MRIGWFCVNIFEQIRNRARWTFHIMHLEGWVRALCSYLTRNLRLPNVTIRFHRWHLWFWIMRNLSPRQFWKWDKGTHCSYLWRAVVRLRLLWRENGRLQWILKYFATWTVRYSFVKIRIKLRIIVVLGLKRYMKHTLSRFQCQLIVIKFKIIDRLKRNLLTFLNGNVFFIELHLWRRYIENRLLL